MASHRPTGIIPNFLFQHLVIPIAVLLFSVGMSRLMRVTGSLPGLMTQSGGGRMIPRAGVTVIRISAVAALALTMAGGPGQMVVGQEVESTEADDKGESGTVESPAENPPPKGPPIERAPVAEAGVESLLTPFVEPLVGESEAGDATGDPRTPRTRGGRPKSRPRGGSGTGGRSQTR